MFEEIHKGHTGIGQMRASQGVMFVATNEYRHIEQGQVLSYMPEKPEEATIAALGLSKEAIVVSCWLDKTLFIIDAYSK